MKISKQGLDKIAEQVLNVIYHSPKYLFTSQIAQQMAKDEEFILKLLKNMEATKLIISINKNQNGKEYKRRKKWKILEETKLHSHKFCASETPNKKQNCDTYSQQGNSKEVYGKAENLPDTSADARNGKGEK